MRRYVNGGKRAWRCAVKQREYDNAYNLSAKGRARAARYNTSPTGALTKTLLRMASVRVPY